MFTSPPGMKDILPPEAYLWQDLENQAKKILDLFGYKPIRTPILENLKLFNRSLGKETEIVKKQMFIIKRQDEEYCLRPEGTAAIVRAYLENKLDRIDGFIKLYYLGPMFRAERPQKGRLRQFHHIGVEALGSSSPYLDSEIISLANQILKSLQINDYQFKINSLGCLKDKEKLSKILHNGLKDKLKSLCPDCKNRFRRNIFRILDCKNDNCKNVVSDLRLSYENYLCNDCISHFNTVKENLTKLNIAYSYQNTLVRGLDYYTRTVFEITHPGLGAQDAIGAGGRYDHLIAQLGGPELGAAGFALGVERLVLAANHKPLPNQGLAKTTILNSFVITLGDEAKKEGFIILNKLRSEGIPSDMDYEDKSLKAQMRRANDLNVKFAILLGENELKKQVATLKDMSTGKQEEISLCNLPEEIKKRGA